MRFLDPSIVKPYMVPHVPAGNTITAGSINNSSHMLKMRARRESRLRRPENKDVRDAAQAISLPASSLTRAITIEEIDIAHQKRKDNRDTLRAFEHTESRQRDQHTQRLRTTKTLNKLGAAERRYIQQVASEAASLESVSQQSTSQMSVSMLLQRPAQSPVSKQDGYCEFCDEHHIPNRPECKFSFGQCPRIGCDILPIMLVGDSGTGVGSRIQGHDRRGGKKMRREHMQHCPVVLTNEFRSSKTCIYCFQELEKAYARRIVNGQVKMVRVNGALECTNPDCDSFKASYTIKSRDAHSAVAIALAGASALLSRAHEVIPPFSPDVQLKKHQKHQIVSTGTPSTVPNIERMPWGPSC